MKEFKYKGIELSIRLLYEGCYSVGKWNIVQFLIRTKSETKALKLAKERLKMLDLDFDRRKDLFLVTGYQLDDDNKEVDFQLSFMENTHIRNQFTPDTYKTTRGDLLKYDCAGDGYDFWYAVDENGTRISERLKGRILVGCISDKILTPYKP